MEARGTSGLPSRLLLHCIQRFAKSTMGCIDMRAGGLGLQVPPSVFPTSFEAEYPMELCRAMVSCFEIWLVQSGAKFPPQLLTNDTKMSARQLRQFGKKQLPPLLSEYWLVADHDIAALFPKAKPLSVCSPDLKTGDDSVVQRAQLNNSFAATLEDQYASLPGTVLRSCGKNDDPGKKWDGVHRTHLQAFQAALHLKHPMDMQAPIPDILIRAIFNVLTLGAAAMLEMRASQCRRNLGMIRSNEEESKLHEGMQRDVQLALRGKRILVWRRLLQETGYPDLAIVDEVVEGLKLVGSSTKSDAFPSGLYPAQQTVEQLSQQSIWSRQSTIGKCRASHDAEADRELWAQSLQEAESGWFSGLYFQKKKYQECFKPRTGFALGGSLFDSPTKLESSMVDWSRG